MSGVNGRDIKDYSDAWLIKQCLVHIEDLAAVINYSNKIGTTIAVMRSSKVKHQKDRHADSLRYYELLRIAKITEIAYQG